MKDFSKLVARLYPRDDEIILDDKRYTKNKIVDMCSIKEIESMFAFIANAKNLFLFERPLLDVEILGGNKLVVDWHNRYVPAPSDIAPIILDVWESDVLRSLTPINGVIDITSCVNQWRRLWHATSGIIDAETLVANLYQVELRSSSLNRADTSEEVELTDLTEQVAEVLNRRSEIETNNSVTVAKPAR